MSRLERDPERGRAVAAELRRLGAKRILIRAAEQGYITELACKMPECFCPEQPAEKPARKKRAKKPSAWAVLKSEGTAAEVAEHLLSHETLGDVTWADRPERQGGVERAKGESREAFIRRVLLGETPSEETQTEQQEDAA